LASKLSRKGASNYIKNLFTIWKDMPIKKYFNLSSEEANDEETDLN